MGIKSEEVNYKKNFCLKYFGKDGWDLDVLKEVDVLLKDKKGNHILYIESKYIIANETDRRQAFAQTILTNKKQANILSRVALIYQDKDNNDILELIDCTNNSVMYNNDINWEKEKPSQPSKDAIDRINDRISGRITQYINDEIKEFYKLFEKQGDTQIAITEKNVNVVYNQWKNNVKFTKDVEDEQDLINLFLVDILNGTNYKKDVVDENGLFGGQTTEQDLIREGTNLSHYEINYSNDKIRILYEGKENSIFYTIADSEQYAFFWRKYQRPPEKNEFLKILEHSASLYTDKYRRDNGGEYTPSCFVEKQNEILAKHYDLNEFIVFDPCAGVGNLENQFGKDYKQYCYLSTLEQMDVDICKIKGFENAVQFDYLKNDEQPKWKHGGTPLGIDEICRRENRKLMVIMNPPYQNVKGKKNNLAIEFFNKVLELKPQVIVFYYMTESFLRSEIEHYIKSEYKIVSHVFSNAKTTFLLSEWPISQVIFDKDKGDEINVAAIKADRYELKKKTDKLLFIKTYTYDNSRQGLIYSIDEKIKENEKGLILGGYSYPNTGYSINLTNKTKKKNDLVTTNNIMYCLISKGLIFNTHDPYFARNQYVHKGTFDELSEELKCDAIMHSLFYKNCAFTNKGRKNYIVPFTAIELGCPKNDLNVLYPEKQEIDLFTQASVEIENPFDFRAFMSQFDFSEEAKDLYKAALAIAKFYHSSNEYADKDWNDSFYDITNTIMGKDVDSFKEAENVKGKRISKMKTTKGSLPFKDINMKFVVESAYLPIFDKFFKVRRTLGEKINKQLLDAGLLLWERGNLY